MTKRFLTAGVVLILAVLFLAACQSGGEQNTTPTLPEPTEPAAVATTEPAAGAAGGEELISAGEQVFNTHCAACHQENGQGTDQFPALDGNPFVTSQDTTPIIETVINGREAMPAFGDQLTDQEIAEAISYIRNAWSNNASVVTVDQVHQVHSGQ